MRKRKFAMSYESLIRWGFAHEQRVQSAVYYVINRREKRQRAQRVVMPDQRGPTVEQIADIDNLFRVFDELKAHGGPAPGPDGFTYADWSRREVAGILRVLSSAVITGNYRPQPTRPVSHPKGNGQFRTLRIANLCDRVVATALNQAMQPVWEPVFLPQSMGFRPNRGVRRLLAELERVMLDQDRWVLAIDDVTKAFDNVVIADVMMDHSRYLTDNSLLSLIEVVLRGSDSEKRKGIDQGGAYSPTALNVRLHHAHDLGVNQGHQPPWYRYADNLVYICQSVSEGEQMLDKARQLLEQADFTLKGEDGPPADLRRRKAQLLGFTLCHRNGAIQFNLGKHAWNKLEEHLLQAHQENDPNRTAQAVLSGWIASGGPAFESLRPDTLGRMLNTIIRLGFREIGSRQNIAGWCRDAWVNWIALRKRAARSNRMS
jgi:RNA-directed DNA polymerase